MLLFAYIAASKEQAEGNTMSIVEGFLRHEVSQDLVKEYMDFYETNYSQLKAKQAAAKNPMKFNSSASTKILSICEAINKELVQRQKVIILVRILEFIKSDNPDGISDIELEYVETISQKFNISSSEYRSLSDYIFSATNGITPESSNILIIDDDYGFHHDKIKHIYKQGLIGQIIVFLIPSVNMYLFVFQGEKELIMNGQVLNPDRVHILSVGSSIRGGKIVPIYFSDIVSTYNYDRSKSRIIFEVDKLEYKFSNGSVGLHSMSFLERSGKLVGIMGASGAGKTTLLNVLNGTQKPSKGQVLINGIDLHNNDGELDGLIGYVSQDDLLIEELTVFQNLYYAAKQCFDNYSRFMLYRTVLKLLRTLGLYEIRNMVVGNPLNKRISGGQRKRLNIALELIREPAILFLDEPTSGLSSRDSENIMDLLKELTIKGKLVFVVIHQPSSDIFKMFDNLILLDTGGYLIYKGDPVESISYFKSSIRQANCNDSECPTCGNVNPEQIFNIIESHVVDEYGNATQQRKISPKQWNDAYVKEASKERKRSILVKHLPEINFKIPNFIKQFFIFIKRDVLSKFSNGQYVLMNFFETPAIALVLSFIIKYRNISHDSADGYSLLNSCNLPVYLFISIIVGLFVGLTVSAQEIIKDRTIRKREAFLNLSKGAYLSAKVVVLLFISAYQSFMFVLIGNGILEIHDMFLKYWLILFAVWLSANLLGLNISDALKTQSTVYILIPFMLIPQIAISGVLISFDKLNPTISSPGVVPCYGDILVARWAYEALAVEQFKNNAYEAPIYEFEKSMQNALIKRDFWLTLLENKLAFYNRYKNDESKKAEIEDVFTTLRNEISVEIIENGSVSVSFDVETLTLDSVTPETISKVAEYFARLRQFYVQQYISASKAKDNYVSEQQKTPEMREEYLALKRRYHNESLTEFVTNNRETERVIEYENHLYQKANPIYLDPQDKYLRAHFYAPRKRLFNVYIETYWVNFVVILLHSVMLFVMLYFGVFRKIINYFSNIKEEYNSKKEQKLISKGHETRHHRKSFSDLKIWR